MPIFRQNFVVPTAPIIDIMRHSPLSIQPPLPRLRLRGLAALLTLSCAGVATAEERGNFFNDPFLQVTSAIAACPVQEGPMITRAEMRAESHWRIERGTSCYRAGRCRLPPIPMPAGAAAAYSGGARRTAQVEPGEAASPPLVHCG